MALVSCRSDLCDFHKQALVQMPMDAPGRLDLMRKYGAIYGRFDSKRKNEKPMSLHEVLLNFVIHCFHLSTSCDLNLR